MSLIYWSCVVYMMAKRMPRPTTGVADGSLDTKELGLIDGAEYDIADGNLDGSLEG